MPDRFSNSGNVQDVRKRLRATFAHLKRQAFLSRILFGISGTLALLLFFILLESQFYLSPFIKSGVIALAIIAFGLIFHQVKTGFEKVNFTHFYRNFSRTSELNEINYSLDLENDDHADPDLVQAAIDQNLSQVEPSVLEEAIQNHQSSHIAHAFFSRSRVISGLMFILLLSTAFSLNSATYRMLVFWKAFEKPNPFLFTVTPQNITLEQGSDFMATVAFNGNTLPEKVSLYLKTAVEQQFRTRNMEFKEGEYRSIPLPINNDLEYYIQMDEYRSEIYRANVQLRPRFSRLDALISPPAYTGLEAFSQSYPFSLIRAYQGSEIRLEGMLNKEIAEAVIHSGGASDTLSVSSEGLTSYTLRVTDNDTLFFRFADPNGLTNRNDFKFYVEPIVDEFPLVELVEPSSSFEMVEPKQLDIIYKATDDFLITKASLHYEFKKAYVDEPVSGTLQLPRPQNGVLQNYEWDLSEFQLSPLDELTFWIEATDNDAFNGAKTARSQAITLTVPSLVDYFETLDEQENEVSDGLEEISNSFEQIEQQYEEFKESLRENPETNYEQYQQLDEIRQQQEEVENKIRELNEKFEAIKEELSQNNLLSEETQRAYEELKQLMEDIDDPEFQKILQEMMEQFNELTPEQLREAMENFEFNEELYKQRLERTIELFKQLKLISDLEKLAKSFEDQARQEKELNEHPPSEEVFNNKRIQDRKQIDQLKEALDKLSENTSEKNRGQVDKLRQEAQKELDRIQQAIDQLLKNKEGNKESKDGEGDGNQDKSTPQNFEQQFQHLADETRKTMAAIGQQQLQVNIAGLQYILYSLLTLSNEQELLVTYTAETESRSLAYVDYAREQRNVHQIFTHLSDSLFQLSTQIPSFSNQINKRKQEVERQLARAIEQMAERDRRNSSVASRQAFGGINELAYMIANLLDQLQNQQNGGGGSGTMSLQQMMEQMQQMQGDQQKINEQIQQMINDLQGERLSQNQMERLEQLARQQNAIRKQLQELQQSGAANGDRIGSELQQMIEEMKDTINDLRGGALDPLLQERQVNIMTRMLEAEKALQERGEEEKREGVTANELNRVTPPELTLEELEKQIRSRLNDPNFTKYAPDYQRLIERYFELLKQIRERSIN